MISFCVCFLKPKKSRVISLILKFVEKSQPSVCDRITSAVQQDSLTTNFLGRFDVVNKWKSTDTNVYGDDECANMVDGLRNRKPGGRSFGSPELRMEHCWNSSSKENLFESHSNFLRSPVPSSLFFDVRCSETGDRKIWNIEMSIIERGSAKLGGKRRATYATDSIALPLPSNWNQSHELVISLTLSWCH